MSDQVGRKKSYRWVSASQASYDGSAWDSDDDGDYGGGYGDEGTTGDLVARGDTISKLPALPKLNYDAPGADEKDSEDKVETNEESDVIEELPELPGDFRTESFAGEDAEHVGGLRPESFAGEDVLDNYMGSTIASSSPDRKSLNRVKPSPLDVEEEEEYILPNMEQTLSGDSSGDSVPRRTPVNEDLDNLMAQISREMGQQGHQGQPQAQEEDLDEVLNASNEEEFGVSRNGYFNNLVESDNEQENENENEKSSEDENESIRSEGRASELVGYSPDNHLERNALTTSLSYSHSSKETGLGSCREEEHDRESPVGSPEVTAEHPQSHSPGKSSVSKGSSFDESEDDALSYTESLNYHTSRNDLENHAEVSDRVDVNEPDSDEGFMRIHKSGYFGKMVDGDEDDAGTMHKDDLDGDDKQVKLISGDRDNASKQAIEEGEPASNEQKESGDAGKHLDDKPVGEEEKVIAVEGKRSISGQKSVNLGGWRPDTNSARSGFVQETAKKAPPGYVYDEDGKLVDLTPASMKQRGVSTYSEAESAWNPFPSQHNGELETIKDTKTLYDNQTIYNVPGLMTNNQNLPPLPNLGNQQHLAHEPTGSNSSDPKSLTVGSSIATVSEIDSDKGPMQSHFKELLSAPDLNDGSEVAKETKETIIAEEPGTPKTVTVTGANAVPYLDLNKVISGKSSHTSKIQDLQRYYNELLEHDTGIQDWIEASLKTSAIPEGGYLFNEYKVNKHVKDAYANADELSKRHTVSNTVASVNQNVSQLTKKVFSHPMKSRGLFASIGKKRI